MAVAVAVAVVDKAKKAKKKQKTRRGEIRVGGGPTNAEDGAAKKACGVGMGVRVRCWVEGKVRTGEDR